MKGLRQGFYVAAMGAALLLVSGLSADSSPRAERVGAAADGFLFSDYLRRTADSSSEVSGFHGSFVVETRPSLAAAAAQLPGRLADEVDTLPLRDWALGYLIDDKRPDYEGALSARGWRLADWLGEETLLAATAGGRESGFLRRLDVDVQSELGGRRAQVGISALGALRESNDDAVAWQLRGFKTSGGAGGNAGLLYRWALLDNMLGGANVFLDYEQRDSHDFFRWSAGGELRSAWADVFANVYRGISDPRENGDERIYTADGYELELNVHSPDLPWLIGAATYYHWDGQYDDSNDDGVRFGLKIAPVNTPLILELEYEDADKGEDFAGRIAYSGAFGKLAPSAARGGSFNARDWFFAPANREYSQRIRTGIEKGFSITGCPGPFPCILGVAGNAFPVTVESAASDANLTVVLSVRTDGMTVVRGTINGKEINETVITLASDMGWPIQTGSRSTVFHSGPAGTPNTGVTIYFPRSGATLVIMSTVEVGAGGGDNLGTVDVAATDATFPSDYFILLDGNISLATPTLNAPIVAARGMNKGDQINYQKFNLDVVGNTATIEIAFGHDATEPTKYTPLAAAKGDFSVEEVADGVTVTMEQPKINLDGPLAITHGYHILPPLPWDKGRVTVSAFTDNNPNYSWPLGDMRLSGGSGDYTLTLLGGELMIESAAAGAGDFAGTPFNELDRFNISAPVTLKAGQEVRVTAVFNDGERLSLTPPLTVALTAYYQGFLGHSNPPGKLGAVVMVGRERHRLNAQNSSVTIHVQVPIPLPLTSAAVSAFILHKDGGLTREHTSNPSDYEGRFDMDAHALNVSPNSPRLTGGAFAPHIVRGRSATVVIPPGVKAVGQTLRSIITVNDGGSSNHHYDPVVADVAVIYQPPDFDPIEGAILLDGQEITVVTITKGALNRRDDSVASISISGGIGSLYIQHVSGLLPAGHLFNPGTRNNLYLAEGTSQSDIDLDNVKSEYWIIDPGDNEYDYVEVLTLKLSVVFVDASPVAATWLEHGDPDNAPVIADNKLTVTVGEGRQPVGRLSASGGLGAPYFAEKIGGDIGFDSASSLVFLPDVDRPILTLMSLIVTVRDKDADSTYTQPVTSTLLVEVWQCENADTLEYCPLPPNVKPVVGGFLLDDKAVTVVTVTKGAVRFGVTLRDADPIASVWADGGLGGLWFSTANQSNLLYQGGIFSPGDRKVYLPHIYTPEQLYDPARAHDILPNLKLELWVSDGQAEDKYNITPSPIITLSVVLVDPPPLQVAWQQHDDAATPLTSPITITMGGGRHPVARIVASGGTRAPYTLRKDGGGGLDFDAASGLVYLPAANRPVHTTLSVTVVANDNDFGDVTEPVTSVFAVEVLQCPQADVRGTCLPPLNYQFHFGSFQPDYTKRPFELGEYYLITEPDRSQLPPWRTFLKIRVGGGSGGAQIISSSGEITVAHRSVVRNPSGHNHDLQYPTTLTLGQIIEGTIVIRDDETQGLTPDLTLAITANYKFNDYVGGQPVPPHVAYVTFPYSPDSLFPTLRRLEASFRTFDTGFVKQPPNHSTDDPVPALVIHELETTGLNSRNFPIPGIPVLGTESHTTGHIRIIGADRGMHFGGGSNGTLDKTGKATLYIPGLVKPSNTRGEGKENVHETVLRATLEISDGGSINGLIPKLTITVAFYYVTSDYEYTVLPFPPLTEDSTHVPPPIDTGPPPSPTISEAAAAAAGVGLTDSLAAALVGEVLRCEDSSAVVACLGVRPAKKLAFASPLPKSGLPNPNPPPPRLHP